MIFHNVTGSIGDFDRCVEYIKEGFDNGHFGLRYIEITSHDSRRDLSEKRKNQIDRN